jgi:hypothetical protein
MNRSLFHGAAARAVLLRIHLTLTSWLETHHQPVTFFGETRTRKSGTRLALTRWSPP